MIVVADPGPLIALGKLDRIDLLEVFGTPTVIPPRVRRELLSQPKSETQELERALRRRIQVRDVPALSATTNEVVSDLNLGEREAVSLAVGLDEETVLVMDDKAGRRVARQLDCSVTGVIGVPLRAKELGHIKAVAPLLTSLRDEGYWLSDATVEHAKKLAGEATNGGNPSEE